MSGGGSFRFVEGATSDLAFTASGASLSEVFASAAEALLAATVERPEAVEPRITRSLHFTDTDLELLLLRFLNELIYLRDAEQLLLRPIALRIATSDAGATLDGELAGERIDRARHALAIDVKAATAHALRVERAPQGWSARVTLDV